MLHVDVGREGGRAMVHMAILWIHTDQWPVEVIH